MRRAVRFVGLLLDGRRRGTDWLEPARLGLETDWSPSASSSAPASAAPVRSRCGTARLRDRRAGERPRGQPVEGDPERRGHVTHRVEGSIVRYDFEHVTRPRAGEPHAGAHGDPEIAPVADAGGRGAMEELGAEAGEDAPRLVADHAPVADGEELGAPADVIDGQTSDHALDVRGVARVLDVEEYRVAGRRPQTFRAGRGHPRPEPRLRCYDGQSGYRLRLRDRPCQW